ncbi:GNAT family N-acetyltransferase [Parafrigoribacterium soli]|uniref:GNAT family N-acetyltransferase n=1 Tax=Parafrigoribacterium soli TaxID=3144663 RepID=UPI0032EB0E8D
MTGEISIRLNEPESLYELSIDGERVGELVYRNHADTRVFLHTEVDPAHRGKGLATRLIAWALDDTRDAGKHLRVECPAVTEYLKNHPEADFR